MEEEGGEVVLLLGHQRLVVRRLPDEVMRDHLLDKWSRGAVRMKQGLERDMAQWRGSRGHGAADEESTARKDVR